MTTMALIRPSWPQREAIPCARVGDAWVYLEVPRDSRHAAWHKAHWWSVPEWAREKLDDGTYRVDAKYADVATSVLRAYYPHAVILQGPA
jgi:hypothetical protein